MTLEWSNFGACFDVVYSASCFVKMRIQTFFSCTSGHQDLKGEPRVGLLESRSVLQVQL